MVSKMSNKNKQAADIRVRTGADAENELRKVRKYNQYLNYQVDRLWSEIVRLSDELAEVKANGIGGQ